MSIKTRLLQIGVTASLAAAGTLVYQWEGEVREPYLDVVKVRTVCIGHTGKDIHPGLYTEQECSQTFAHDLMIAEDAVEECTPKVTGGPKIAFTSFVFNTGRSAYCKSTLAQKANQGDLKGACKELTKWVYAKGQVIPGLMNRRLAEQKVCLQGLI